MCCQPKPTKRSKNVPEKMYKFLENTRTMCTTMVVYTNVFNMPNPAIIGNKLEIAPRILSSAISARYIGITTDRVPTHNPMYL